MYTVHVKCFRPQVVSKPESLNKPPQLKRIVRCNIPGKYKVTRKWGIEKESMKVNLYGEQKVCSNIVLASSNSTSEM